MPCSPLQTPARTTVTKILVSGDSYATVLVSTSGTSAKGFKLEDRAAWICKIVGGKIVEVDNYCDTAAINE